MDDSRATILIVDDVPKNIQIAMNILREKGYRMLFAQSGEKAFDIIQENSIDLILLDIMMPDLTGFEVCEILKENNKTKDIPVIFLTGSSSPEDIEKAFEVGGLDYIIKPFINIELITKVTTFITLRKLKQQLGII